MNFIKPLTYFLSMSLSGFAAAEVTLTVPDEVTLLVANGKTPKLSGSLFATSKTATLPDGENQIVFRYEPFFSQGNDRIGVESDVIVAKFTANGSELSFFMPKYRDHRVAESEIKQLDWQLIDADDQTVEKTEDKLIKEGLQIGRDFHREVEDYNRAGGIAAIGAPLTVAALKPVVEGHQASSAAEEMLHFWYEKADDETKARFKAFINEQ
ncbi:DUF2057 family protein [Vibrio navarrensis]|uniref:DUF2057 family protein n=1 Tax=Vibrio navarrensis TaxID=29495 RepID=UPI0018675C8E|nr:DUF2057 family protein [Vibrio navarrensis]MBE3651421.1 hypothetical protein [Vibrio navarrensis]